MNVLQLRREDAMLAYRVLTRHKIIRDEMMMGEIPLVVGRSHTYEQELPS